MQQPPGRAGGKEPCIVCSTKACQAVVSHVFCLIRSPLMVLIHTTCISHLAHSTYLSDDPWHNPKSYSCLLQKLCRGLPELFWFWQACINQSLASRLLHHVSSLVQATVDLCSTQSILTPGNASLPSFYLHSWGLGLPPQ